MSKQRAVLRRISCGNCPSTNGIKLSEVILMKKSVRRMTPTERLEFWKNSEPIDYVPYSRADGSIGYTPVHGEFIVETQEQVQEILDNIGRLWGESCCREARESSGAR